MVAVGAGATTTSVGLFHWPSGGPFPEYSSFTSFSPTIPNPLDNLVPDEVVATGTWFNVTEETYISPGPLTKPASGSAWHWGTGYIVTIERYSGGVWSACSPTGLPLLGPVCEDATRIDSTHYGLSRAVLSGSEQVYEGGYLLLPGIGRDYGISIDTGIITFADTVADGTIIRACYIANGPLA